VARLADVLLAQEELASVRAHAQNQTWVPRSAISTGAGS
jgi:hypothetical protein